MDNGVGSYRRFLDGDERAFDEILTQYFDSLTFFINRYLHDVHASEDVAIDTLLQLIIHPNRYDFKTPLKSYLYMIARSRALNELKRRRRHATVALDEAAELSDDELSLADAVIADERRRVLHAAMARLNEPFRTVLHLIYFEEMSYEEAGRVMKKSRKQIDNLLYRAKAALRAELGKDGADLL